MVILRARGALISEQSLNGISVVYRGACISPNARHGLLFIAQKKASVRDASQLHGFLEGHDDDLQERQTRPSIARPWNGCRGRPRFVCTRHASSPCKSE